MKRNSFAVYIVASTRRVLYVGVTNDLERRVWQHKSKLTPGFTSRYNVSRLVYFELYPDVRDAIFREKELKGWKRNRKIEVIEGTNANWEDLAAHWFSDESFKSEG